MVMPRYEFLVHAHAILRPQIYLEIGVQAGYSLALAQAAELAIGVDPVAAVTRENTRPNQDVVLWTAGEFFAQGAPGIPRHGEITRQVDFGYIDGSHLFEDALHDFINIERYCGPRSVIMLDDVLPYNEAIATREQPPGDWTGDVWKIAYVLEEYRADLFPVLVDVAPTGLLMVLDADGGAERTDELADSYDKIVAEWRDQETVPRQVLERDHAISADAALDLLKARAEA